MKNFRISTRLSLLVGLALTIIVAALVYSLYHYQEAMVAERKSKLAAMDESMLTLFQHYHALETAGTLTREEAQTRAKDAVRALRYEDSGYFWINDMNAVIVMHPIKPELDGTDQSGMADPTGKRIFIEFVKAVKGSPTGQDFVDYLWPKPGFEQPVLKYSHVAGFAPWGWIVGTGVYADDLAAMFRRNAIETAVILALGGLAIILAAYGIVKSVTGPVSRLKASMQAIAEEDVSGDVPETDRRDEIGEMAKVVSILRSRSPSAPSFACARASSSFASTRSAARASAASGPSARARRTP